MTRLRASGLRQLGVNRYLFSVEDECKTDESEFVGDRDDILAKYCSRLYYGPLMTKFMRTLLYTILDVNKASDAYLDAHPEEDAVFDTYSLVSERIKASRVWKQIIGKPLRSIISISRLSEL